MKRLMTTLAAAPAAADGTTELAHQTDTWHHSASHVHPGAIGSMRAKERFTHSHGRNIHFERRDW